MASETFTVNLEAKNSAAQKLVAVRDSLKALQAQSAATAQAVKSTAERVKKFSDVSALAAPAMGRLGEGFQRVVEGVNSISSSLGKANHAFRLARANGTNAGKSILIGFSAMSKGVIAELNALRLAALSNPFTAILVGLAAIAAATALIIKRNNEARISAAQLATALNRAAEEGKKIFCGSNDPRRTASRTKKLQGKD